MNEDPVGILKCLKPKSSINYGMIERIKQEIKRKKQIWKPNQVLHAHANTWQMKKEESNKHESSGDKETK